MPGLDVVAVERAVLAASGEEGERTLCDRVTGLPWEELKAVLLMRLEVPADLSAKDLVGRVASLLGSSREVAARALGVSASRVSRNDRVSVTMLDRAQALCRQWFHVCRVVGGEGAGMWFQDPNPGLEGHGPSTCLKRGMGRGGCMT